MLGALEDLMPAGATWTTPRGGFFVWVTLPGGLDAEGDAAARDRRSGWRTCRARRSTPTAAAGTLRLSYCYPPPDRIREGVRRLAGVIESELDLQATFGDRERRRRPRRRLPAPRTPTCS